MRRSESEIARQEVRSMLAEVGMTLDPALAVEVTDFGLGHYAEQGLGLVVRVNEAEYCSKWLTLRPGQRCPSHFHKLKKETFFVLQGEVEMEADGQPVRLTPGQSFTIPPGVRHTFASHTGAVIEEVSTHDENADSYFDDPAIARDTIVEGD